MKHILLLLAFALVAGRSFSQNVDSLLTVKQVDSLLTASNNLRKSGKNEAALPLAQQAAVIAKQKWGEYNAQYAASVHRLASIYQGLRQNDTAEVLYLKAIDLRGKVLGKGHPDYALSLNNIANLYCAKGDYDKAEPLYLEAKEIRAKALGKEHPDYAQSLNNLANIYSIKGDFAKVEPLYLEAKEIRAKALGKEHPDYAKTLNNLAVLYIKMGDYTKAEPLCLEANEIYAKALGKEHPEYAASVNNLASLYYYKGEFDKAEPLYLEAKEILAKALGKEDPNYAQVLEDLAIIYYARGNYDKAEPLFLEASTIQGTALGKEHPDYAASLNILANLYMHKGEYVKAEPLLLESEKIYAKTLGKKHPDYAWAVRDLAIFYQTTNRIPEAGALFLAMNNQIHGLIEESTAYSSENQMIAYVHAFDDKISQFQSFSQAYPSPELIRASFDNAIYFNGFLLENARHLLRSVAGADSLTRYTYEQWQGCRRRLANEYAKPITERRNVAAVEAEAEGYEKTLTRTLPAFSEARRSVHWQNVQTALKPSEAAVEFINYRYFNPEPTDSILYAALVLLPGDTQPRLVPLFEEKELTPLLRGATGGSNFLKINALYAEKNTESKQKSLYELIGNPLESLLSGTQTVYCSPSGLLHRINLAAIPTSSGQTFGDRYQLVILGSTRQLAVQNAILQPVSNEAYLAGGIRYDTENTAMAPATRSTSLRSLEEPETLVFHPDSTSITRGGVLDYLPATAAEVHEIGQTLAKAGVHAKIDTGFYATEEAFRQLGATPLSPRIIHLATHGYFFPDPAITPQKAVGILGQEPVFKASEHPMIRSGLIMAGAKEAWLTGKHPTGQEDGILTAYEISQMNLSGTELVVLSACETGLGDIVGNEGVYGLQRAFKIAGAKYLIMSLWKVDDRSTREFMTAFYRHWLTEKQTVPEAFRVAQREMRVRHSGAYDWAGFVLIE